MNKTSKETKQLMEVFLQVMKEENVTAASVGASSIAIKVPGTQNDAIIVRFSGPSNSFGYLVRMNQERLKSLINREERWQAAALKSQKEAIERADKHAQRMEEYRRQLN